MKKTKSNLNNKIIFIGLGIFLGIPIVIVLAMLLLQNIDSILDLDNKTWLTFWGSYIGGISTLLSIYITSQYYRKENEQTLKLVINEQKVQKVNLILEKILERESIPNSYYSMDSIFYELIEDIEKYNFLQGALCGYFTDSAISIFLDLLNVKDDNGEILKNTLDNYFKIPNDIKSYAYTVGKLSLHKNCAQLINGNPEIAHMLYKEGGSSYGIWHEALHWFKEDDPIGKELDEFFALTNKLQCKMENIKKSMY